MTTDDVFRRIVGMLDHVGIAYMLTGSFASAYHGAPRATQDIDVVVAPTDDQFRRLVALLPTDEYYVEAGAAMHAQRNRGQFNIVDLATGWKIDLIIRKTRAFSREEFDRREVYQGLSLSIATVEDLVLAKLEWAKLGESLRQIEDVANLLKIRWAELDGRYIAKWITAQGLLAAWEAARREAGMSNE